MKRGKTVEPVAPTQCRSRNMPVVSTQVQRGKAVSPTQGRTRNHPATAPTPKKEIGKALPNSYFGNSRTPIHPKFARASAKLTPPS